jgi:hypothetical protein
MRGPRRIVASADNEWCCPKRMENAIEEPIDCNGHVVLRELAAFRCADGE